VSYQTDFALLDQTIIEVCLCMMFKALFVSNMLRGVDITFGTDLEVPGRYNAVGKLRTIKTHLSLYIHTYIHTYHLRFIPEGVAEAYKLLVYMLYQTC
jgi:hypothetical protein